MHSSIQCTVTCTYAHSIYVIPALYRALSALDYVTPNILPWWKLANMIKGLNRQHFRVWM